MKVLTQMIDQFKQTHNGQPPRKIVVAPVGALALILKRSLSPVWGGVDVEMRLFDHKEVVKPGAGTQLGVFLREDRMPDGNKRTRLASCDLV